MAKSVKLRKGEEFRFSSSAGPESRYPWDEWFNGDLLLLERSSGTENEKGTVVEITEKRDYEVPTETMPPKLKSAARKRYKVVQTSRRDPSGNRLADAIIIQARDMTPEEQQAEDVLRAEERDAKKAKLAASRNGTPNVQTGGQAV